MAAIALDTFDLNEFGEIRGKPLPANISRRSAKTGAAFLRLSIFKKYGQSGLEISDLFPKLGALADELCLCVR
jgi:hypothetical protein